MVEHSENVNPILFVLTSKFHKKISNLIKIIINSSLTHLDNTTSMNFVNPISTIVTGEVIVERNENISSKRYSIEIKYFNKC